MANPENERDETNPSHEPPEPEVSHELDSQDSNLSLDDLIVPGSFVALASADFAPYYLLKVSDVCVLTQNKLDYYGNECVAGAKVLIGNYLLLDKQQKKGNSLN